MSARNTRCPNEKLKANRDLDGCRKAILDAVLQAQGKGCGPGILGVCIGGDRATSYEHSKQQLLRKLDDRNPNPDLDKLEQDIVEHRQSTRHRADGFRRQTTLLGAKIGDIKPPARVVFRQRQLHVLGVPAARCHSGCGRENREVVVLNPSGCVTNVPGSFAQ